MHTTERERKTFCTLPLEVCKKSSHEQCFSPNFTAYLVLWDYPPPPHLFPETRCRPRERGADFSPLRLWNLIISQFYKQEAFVSVETFSESWRSRAHDEKKMAKAGVAALQGLRQSAPGAIMTWNGIRKCSHLLPPPGRLKCLCRLRVFWSLRVMENIRATLDGSRLNYGRMLEMFKQFFLFWFLVRLCNKKISINFIE